MTPLPTRLLIALAFAAIAAAQSGWSNRQPATQPPARGFHAIAYDLLAGRTVMFGGWNGTALADTWEWTGASWIQKTTTHSPAGRCCHALAFDLSRGRIVLFGGTANTSTDLDDTWEYDGVDWTQIQPINRPGPRREVRMAYDLARGRVLLFGGGVGGQGTPVFGDTWEWNGVDWTQRNPATSPPARWSHGMTHDFARARIVLFGGSAASITSPLADTWTWDGTNWTQLQVASPPATTRTGLAYDATRDVPILFGGEPNNAETWLFDSVSWRRDPRALAPSPRASFCLAHDVLRGRTVLFGGYSSLTYHGDTWEYDPGVVASWTPFGTGCAGTAGVPLLRPASGSLPILGSTFVLELLSVPVAGIAAITIGFSDQQWNGHTLPWSLGALGMPGCAMRASPDFLFFAPIVAGRATLAWPLPNDPGLVGMRFFDQGLVLEPGVNALGAIVSNAGAGAIGPF